MELNINTTYKIYCPEHREEVRDKLLKLGYGPSNEVSLSYCVEKLGDGFIIHPNDWSYRYGIKKKILWVHPNKFHNGHLEERWPYAIQLTVEEFLGPLQLVRYKLKQHFVI